MMDRRSFITLVGGSILAGPLGAEGQQARNIPRIGMLSTYSFRWVPCVRASQGCYPKRSRVTLRHVSLQVCG